MFLRIVGSIHSRNFSASTPGNNCVVSARRHETHEESGGVPEFLQKGARGVVRDGHRRARARLPGRQLGPAARLSRRCQHLHPPSWTYRQVVALFLALQRGCWFKILVLIFCCNRACCRYEKDGEALLVLLPSEEGAMVQRLKDKKIPVESIK